MIGSEVIFTFSANEPVEGFKCAVDTMNYALDAKPCTSPFNTGPLTPGVHSFAVLAQKAGEAPGFNSRVFVIASGGEPAGPGGSDGGSGSPGGSGVGVLAPAKPIVSNLLQSAARWREGSALTRLSRAAAKAPRGTTFSFALNQAATVKLSFTQSLTGREVRGRCVARTKTNRSKHACTRTLTAGTLTLKGHLDANKVRFEGQVSTTRKLKPGRYKLVLVAFASGSSSAPRSLNFTIVR